MQLKFHTQLKKVYNLGPVLLLIIFSFQTRSSELDKQKELVDELRSKITSLEEGKGWLERRLAETEVRLIELRHEKTCLRDF